MVDLIDRRPLPVVPIPRSSTQPKIVERVVIEQRELRGAPGKDGAPGKNGVDGKNAFPDKCVEIRLPYSKHPMTNSIRVLNTNDFASGMREVGEADRYRVTITSSLDDGAVAPVGIKIAICKSKEDIYKLVPNRLQISPILASLPAFSLMMYVEYMTNE